MKYLLSLLLTLSTLTPAFGQTTLWQGGTGQSTSTVGDLLVGTSSALRYSRLPIGAAGSLLQASSTSPFRMEWIDTSTLGFATGTNAWAFSGTNIYAVNTGNVGVGSTSPGVKFTTQGNAWFGGNITATGTATITATTTSSHFHASTLGTALFPAFSFSNDVDTGIFSPGANTFSFSTNGSERVRVNATGQVGINDVSGALVQARLVVSSSTSGETTNVLLLRNSNSSATGTGVALLFDPNGQGIDRAASIKSRQAVAGNVADLGFFTSNGSTPVERMTINQSGLVGIGTTTPAHILSIVANSGDLLALAGTGSNNTVIRLRDDNTETAAIYSLNGETNLRLRGVGDVYIDGGGVSNGDLTVTSGGLVGVGTTSPIGTFSILGIAGINPFEIASSTGARMVTIDQMGDLGLGSSTPGSRLVVQGNGYFGGNLIATGTLSLAGALNASSTLGVTGAVNLFSTLNVVGQTTLTTASTTGVSATNFFSTGTSTFATGVNGSYVAIGTTTPTSRLEIFGVGQNTAALTDSGARGDTLALNSFSGSANAGGALTFGNFQSAATGSIGFAAIKGLLTNGGNQTTGDLAFSTRNATTDSSLTERLRITATGNVGIGSTTPGVKLAVSGSASFGSTVAAARRVDIDTSGRMTFLYPDNSLQNQITFSNSGITAAGQGSGMLFQHSTTTSNPLNAARIMALTEGDYTSAATNISGLGFYTAANGSLSERMRITSSGNVGIGTTTPQALLSVATSAATSTVYIGAAGFPGRIIMRDTPSGGACTQITTAAGVITGAVVACP